MAQPHPVEHLFARLTEIRPYGGGMVEIDRHLPGLGFFPGGDGLWKAPGSRERPPLPLGGIMILGNTFQCTANYPALLVRGEEDRQKDATWRNLLTFLATVGIDPGVCFFTNAHIGLVEGNDAMGTVPAMRDTEFLGRCRRFFLHQIALVQPRLILALGRKVPAFIAPLSPQTAIWSEARTWAKIDADDGALVAAVRFPGTPRPVTIACLLHPSFRGPNLRRRTFAGLTGGAAEEALARKALDCSRT